MSVHENVGQESEIGTDGYMLLLYVLYLYGTYWYSIRYNILACNSGILLLSQNRLFVLNIKKESFLCLISGFLCIYHFSSLKITRPAAHLTNVSVRHFYLQRVPLPFLKSKEVLDLGKELI